jgi:proteasome alpha subunit
MDEEGCTVLGGRAETIAEGLGTRFQQGMGADAAIRLCVDLLAGPEGSLGPDQLEVAILDRARARRAFRRIEGAELSSILAG